MTELDIDEVRRYVADALETTGWSATELARKIGVAPSTISRFMNDRRAKHVLSLKTLKAIAAAAELPLPPGVVGAPRPPLPPGERRAPERLLISSSSTCRARSASRIARRGSPS